MDAKEFKQVCIDLGHRDITDDKVQQMLNEADLNNDGVISFNEFLVMFSKLGAGSQFQIHQTVESKAGALNQAVGESGFTSSYLVEEKEVLARSINHHLADDQELSHLLPMGIDNDDFFFVLGDGVILCKLVNLVQSGTIDMRAVNKK